MLGKDYGEINCIHYGKRNQSSGGEGGETGAVCMRERKKNGKLKILKNNYIYSVNPDWKAYRIAWNFKDQNKA